MWCVWTQDLSSMAEAAEKFRLEMDALREELNAPMAMDLVRIDCCGGVARRLVEWVAHIAGYGCCVVRSFVLVHRDSRRRTMGTWTSLTRSWRWLQQQGSLTTATRKTRSGTSRQLSETSVGVGVLVVHWETTITTPTRTVRCSLTIPRRLPRLNSVS